MSGRGITSEITGILLMNSNLNGKEEKAGKNDRND